MAASDYNFLTNREEILQALVQSKENGNAIAIRTRELGDELVISAVEEIEIDDGVTFILVKQYDASGYILPSSRFMLGNISAVYPFASAFTNPFIESLKRERTWFF